MAKRMHFVTAHSKRRRERILEALKGCKLTARELCELIPMDNSTACRYLATLMEEKPRLIRIADWLDNGLRGEKAPIYTLGSGANKRQPRMTGQETYQRRIADPQRLEQRRRQWSIDYRKRTGKPPPAPAPAASPFAALGL